MTELIWEGKYDEHGRKVAPARIPLPFQTVETVNESAAERDRNLEMFASGKITEWRNRLIWGDKKYVLPSLLGDLGGRVNLIYIDPPFATGGDFSFTATLPGGAGDTDDSFVSFVKQPSVLEQKAYRDTWGSGLAGYLKWFFDGAIMLRELLASDGTLYVHLDWHVGHHVKVLLDEVFGAKNFRAEVVWQKLRSVKSQSSHFANMHDVLLVYSAGEQALFNPIFVAKNPELLDTHYRHTDPTTGRRYNLDNFTQAGPGPARRFGDKVLPPPPGKHWIWSQERIDEGMKAGQIVFSKGGLPYVKRYFDDNEGTRVGDIWTDINPVNQVAVERTDYPTQKPEALLERVIRASSREGDLVLDCFSGSGTTAAVAERLGRRWVACDFGRFAIHTTRKRLLGIPGVRPFVVQNLGKYERQAWQVAEFGESAEAAAQRYRQFVLELYHAQPVTGYAWLHGNKRGRLVHVGGVDAPVTMADVTAMVTEFRKAMGKGKDAPAKSGIDVLGWDFAFELNETARQQAGLAGIDLRLIRIPRELLEKKAVEQGDIKFFELAALKVKPTIKKRSVTLELQDFIIPLDDVPEDVQKAVTHWEQWIDYWAVDWNNSDDTFHNEWQSYRTRKDRTIARATTHTYAEPGKYRVVVKVIDILGNDTTKLLQVEVK